MRTEISLSVRRGSYPMCDKHYKNILWGGAAALLIFAPLCRGAVRLWSITPVLLVIYSLVFLWFWRLNNHRETIVSLIRSPLDLLIFLFGVLAVISSIFSIDHHNSFYTLLRLLGFVGFYYLVLNNFDSKMRNRLLGVVLGLATALSLYGLLQYFGIFGHSWWFPENFLAATYVNHNHFAGFLELVIPVALGILASCPSGRFYLRLGLACALAVLSAAFILTQSRAGWLSLGVALSVMVFILAQKAGQRKKNLFVFCLIGVVIFGFLYIQRGTLLKRVKETTALSAPEKDPSFETRLKIWQASLKMVGDRPWAGFGLGAFDAGFYPYRPEALDTRPVYAHNDYLHMAAEMGVLAPLLMIGILFVLLKTGLRRGADFITLGCTAGVLSLAFHGLADFNFHIPANMLLLTVYAAFIMSTHRGQGE